MYRSSGMGLSERSLDCKKNKKNLSALCVSAVTESVGFSTLFRSDFCLENGEYHKYASISHKKVRLIEYAKTINYMFNDVAFIPS